MFEIIAWLFALMALIVGFSLAWRWSRRRFLIDDDDSSDRAPWSLQELRDLKDRGRLSKDEFEQLRQQIIAGYKDTSEDDLDGDR